MAPRSPVVSAAAMGPFLARQYVRNPLNDSLAQEIDAGARTGRIASRRDRRARYGETHRAQLPVPGPSGEIEPARDDRRKRRLENCPNREYSARLKPGVGGTNADANAPGGQFRRNTRNPRLGDRYPPCTAPVQRSGFDGPAHRYRSHAAFEHRCLHRDRPDLGERESSGQGSEPDQDGTPGLAPENQRRCKQYRGRDGKPRWRLVRQREIAGDPEPEGDGKPQNPAVPLGGDGGGQAGRGAGRHARVAKHSVHRVSAGLRQASRAAAPTSRLAEDPP